MTSVNAEIGAVLERGGTYFVRQDDFIDDSHGAANEDHNYTKNNLSKKEEVIVSASDMKHKADICQEVTKVLKSEETVPEWELDLSDSNDSKENLPRMVIKSDTSVTDVNSNNAACSVTKLKFNLSNILPIPSNISVQRLPSSPAGQYEDQLSSASPSSTCNENISMVPPCSLAKKGDLSETKAKAEESSSGGPQAHPLKEQWVVKKSVVPKAVSQAASERSTLIPSMPGYAFAGQQSEPEPEEGPPCKKVKQSPYFPQPAPSGQHQVIRADQCQPSSAQPGQNQIIGPAQSQPIPTPGQYHVMRSAQAQPGPALGQYQVIRPEQAHSGPALMRQVRPGQARSELARRGRGRGTPRWPPPSQMLLHSRSLPSSISPRHPLRFPPQRFFSGGPAQIPLRRKHPIHQIPKASPGMNPPEATPPPKIVSLSSHPQVRQLPPSLSVCRVSPPSMPVLPLQTLATALAGLGMQEGRRKVVQLNLTVSQIEALSKLGIREEGD